MQNTIAESTHRILSKLHCRRSDTRAVLTKAFCAAILERGYCNPAHLEEAQLLRGDIESAAWRARGVPCLYCGRAASEVDHYKSAVAGGRGRFIADTPANRVPSCRGCHRAGKDAHASVVEWHALPLAECSPMHPRRVVPHEKWLRAHAAVREWDAFHASVIHTYISPHSEMLATAVDAIVERMYSEQRAAVRTLVEEALRRAV